MYINERDEKLNISFEKDRDDDIQLWEDENGTHAKIGNNIYGDGSSKDQVWEKGEGIASVQTKGTNCFAQDNYAVAEGYATRANWKAHAEGESTYAEGIYSHAEGCSLTTASGDGSHAEGAGTHAAADFSHTEGSGTATVKDTVTGAHAKYSHAEGCFTATNNQSEHAEGQNNVSHFKTPAFGNAGNTIHSIGIGPSQTEHKNAVEVMQNGDVYIIGIGGFDGANYADAKTLQEVISELTPAN